MTEDESSDDETHDDFDHLQLSPEQIERMSATLRSITPRFEHLHQDTSAAIAKMLDRTGDFLRGQAQLQAQMDAIARKALARHAALQIDIDKVAARLLSKFDVTGLNVRVLEAFSVQQSALLVNLGPALASISRRFYPPNLLATRGVNITRVIEVVMSDGIPLYGVPRAATAQALMQAAGTRERREILGRRWKTISVDCRELLSSCESRRTAPYIPFALAALDALDAGHTDAAQALGGSLIDTLVTERFGKSRHQYTPNKKTTTTEAYNRFTIREFIAYAPIWQAYQQFFISDGDKIPLTFSRHATVHAVSRRQFSRRNAVQALMLVSSLLYRLDEDRPLQTRV